MEICREVLSVINSELYKIFKQKLIILLFIISFLFFALIESNISDKSVLYMDLFQIITFFIIGFIWSLEYSFTTIRLLITRIKRRKIFIGKTIISFVCITIVFVIYVICNFIYGNRLSITVIAVQCYAVVIHMIFMIFIANLIKGITNFSLASIVIFFVYHFIITIETNNSVVQLLLKFVYANIYISSYSELTNFNNIITTSCIVMVVYIVSLYIFEKQDIS